MTTEEAINIMKVIVHMLEEKYDTDRVEDALDMAIKALEQQQRDCNTCKHSDNGNCAYTEECHECMWKSKYEQQPCEDCISREAVDEYITNLLSGYLYDEERTRLEDLTAFIWELPSVQPCEDCTVIKKLSKKYYVEDAYGYTDEDIVNKVNEIIDVVNELSSVTPTRPTARWIDIGDEGLVFKCSICGTKKTIESHYCPNCGAIMTESEDKE